MTSMREVEYYENSNNLISIPEMSSIFISWANVIRTQYLIPNKRDKVYIVSVFLGATVNVVINLILIPQMQALGTAVGTLCAEFSVCAYQTYKVRKEIKVYQYLKESMPLLLNRVIMYLVVINVSLISSTIIALIIKIILGAAIYLLLVSIY